MLAGEGISIGESESISQICSTTLILDVPYGVDQLRPCLVVVKVELVCGAITIGDHAHLYTLRAYLPVTDQVLYVLDHIPEVVCPHTVRGIKDKLHIHRSIPH